MPRARWPCSPGCTRPRCPGRGRSRGRFWARCAPGGPSVCSITGERWPERDRTVCEPATSTGLCSWRRRWSASPSLIRPRRRRWSWRRGCLHGRRESVFPDAAAYRAWADHVRRRQHGLWIRRALRALPGGDHTRLRRSLRAIVRLQPRSATSRWIGVWLACTAPSSGAAVHRRDRLRTAPPTTEARTTSCGFPRWPPNVLAPRKRW